MTKKKKILLISVAVTLVLVLTVGGPVYAQLTHQNVGGDKLIGTGEMGTDYYSIYQSVSFPVEQYRSWDTQFIITNPNCEDYLTIEWVALIAGEYSDRWDPEEVIAEGTPEDWWEHIYGMWGPPDGDSWPDWLYRLEIPDELTPHEVWQVSIAELIAAVAYEPAGAGEAIEDYDLNKYTLEITWSGALYWQWWRWAEARPLIGWAKEKCWYVFFDYLEGPVTHFGMAMSEAEMDVFRSPIPFSEGEPYFPAY